MGKEMKRMSVGEFLILRLHQMGVTDIFGVPGDFNMEFLDLIEDAAGVSWVGCCNELNASCAADGYARVRGLGCLVTTFGVGELSAMNGHAGAYSEMVRVVHVVGSPATEYRRDRAMLHHTLGDGDFSRFQSMFEGVSAYSALLQGKTAAEEIDAALLACWHQARPVYLSLPTDVSREMIKVDVTPLDLTPPTNDVGAEAEAIDKIFDAIQKAHRPVLIVDACLLRYDCTKEVSRFIKKSGMLVVASPMGKAVVDETFPQFQGVYLGTCSQEARALKLVESADLILCFGAVKSDFNTGGFSYHLNPSITIEFHSNHTKVFNAVYPKVGMKRLLPKLTEKVQPSKPILCPPSAVSMDNFKEITQDGFWKRINQFIQPGDIVVAEMGTSCFGILEVQFPRDTRCITQFLWGSIGYSVGAALGAAMAAKGRRVMLFVGDGSFQVACQEFSTMGRYHANILIFLINNKGYTIERLIHGPSRPYNSIQGWNYSQSPIFFDLNHSSSSKVSTHDELDRFLQTHPSTPALHLVEVIMDKLDAPASLKAQAKLTASANYA